MPLDEAIGASGALDEASQRSFDVEGGRAIVTVYATPGDAAAYGSFGRPRVLRVRNIVAVAIKDKSLSTRLRAALDRAR
jgi:hypothetical protein